MRAEGPLGDLLGPDAEEVSCERCFELIDAYVETEIARGDAGRRFPGMEAHLDGCPACREDEQSLRALLELSPGRAG